MAGKILSSIILSFLSIILCLAQSRMIIVDKLHLQLLVIENADTLLSVPVCVGSNYGDKVKEGDKRTPEGSYSISQIQNSAKWKHDFNDGKGLVIGAKPEYIIPQILLHSVVKSNNDGYSGIIFTSTRRFASAPLEDMNIYDNLAIPVMSNRYAEYCKDLASFLQETEPIHIEHELLKGNITIPGTLMENNSLFSKLEDYLNQQPFYNILD